MKFNNLTQQDKTIMEKSISKISVKNLLEECYKKDSLEPSTHKKTKGYLSISQISGNACMRKAYYTLLDYPKDEKFSFESHSILKIGTLYHEMVQETLLKHNKIHYVEQFLQNEKYKLCGSIDGVFIDEEHHTLNDFKTISMNGLDYVLRTNKAKKDHIAQVHLYSYMFSEQFKQPINSMKITYLHKNQNPYTIRIDQSKKNIKDTVTYLNTIYEWMQSKDQNTLKVETHISKLESSLNELERLTEIKSDEDYHIKEIDIDFSQKVLDEELDKVSSFWQLVDSNKKILEQNKLATKEKDIKKIKLPNKISVDYKCNSCPFLQECRNGIKLERK